MKVAILGGSGFIGRAVQAHLLERGNEVLILSRNPQKVGEQNKQGSYSVIKWPITVEEASLKNVDAIINLAGETINQRWSEAAKKRILTSRVETTKQLVTAIRQGVVSPKILINGSAIGYYGTSLEEIFVEESRAGADFLAQVTRAWEREAEQATALGVQVVKVRIGVVLAAHGGALPKMLLPYRLFAGGTMGSGKQWVSWIHLTDLVRIFSFLLEQEVPPETVNAVAPHPVRMTQFGETIAQVLKRPHWLPAPSFALRLALGEMSDLILKGQHVQPKRLQEAGFAFQFPHLQDALPDILK